MGKTADSCQAIVVPGMAPSIPVAPVVPENIFGGLESNQAVTADELVVPFHAWGSFFDVQPGQSVKIEGPEDASQDYQVVPKYVKGADMQDLEICEVQFDIPKTSFVVMASAPHYWHFTVKADAQPQDKIMIPMEYNGSYATFNFIVADQSVTGLN